MVDFYVWSTGAGFEVFCSLCWSLWYFVWYDDLDLKDVPKGPTPALCLGLAGLIPFVSGITFLHHFLFVNRLWSPSTKTENLPKRFDLTVEANFWPCINILKGLFSWAGEFFYTQFPTLKLKAGKFVF